MDASAGDPSLAAAALRDDFLPNGVAIKHADRATTILEMFSLRCRLQHMGHEVLQGRHMLREGHSSHGAGSYASRLFSLRDSTVL
jgi:hypothetical protein